MYKDESSPANYYHTSASRCFKDQRHGYFFRRLLGMRHEARHATSDDESCIMIEVVPVMWNALRVDELRNGRISKKLSQPQSGQSKQFCL